MSEKINIQEILMKQFAAAGDTQYMNGNEGIDATYSVNRRWLNNFAKLIVEAVVDKCAEGNIYGWVTKESILKVKTQIEYD